VVLILVRRAIGITEDNPSLDQDDTDGYGPENITLQQPEEGTYTYKVHYYSDHGNGPTTATIIVYINEQPAATFSKELTSNEVWDVCTIDWPQGTVTENQSGSASSSQFLSNQTGVLSGSFSGSDTSSSALSAPLTDPAAPNQANELNNSTQENSPDNSQQNPSDTNEVSDQTQGTPTKSSQGSGSDSSSDSSSQTIPENTSPTDTIPAS